MSGPLQAAGADHEPADRQQLARTFSSPHFEALLPGRYEVWAVEGRRAWRQEVEIGAERTTLTFDLAEHPGQVLRMQFGQGGENEIPISVHTLDGLLVPFNTMGRWGIQASSVARGAVHAGYGGRADEAQEIEFELPAGDYRIGYALTHGAWAERDIDLRSDRHVLLGEKAALRTITLGVTLAGRPLAGAQLLIEGRDVPGGNVRMGLRADLDAAGQAHVTLRPGPYVVSDVFGRRISFELNEGDMQVSVEMR